MWLREGRAELSGNNDTTKAINCCLSRRDAFSRFLDDGRLCKSQNTAERELQATLRDEKIGPSPAPMRAAGVRLPSTVSSPPTSTHRLGSPTCLPDHPAKRIDELLPWNWQPSRRRSRLLSTISLPPRTAYAAVAGCALRFYRRLNLSPS
ncbi:transposase [Bradyrhizobium sp. RT3a]|uniref:IS66 family transposase n=1 Tax=unclassified Bradyrhizobium TaxID=2631580 RepID=UPI0033968642